jgi:hypothetical protein
MKKETSTQLSRPNLFSSNKRVKPQAPESSKRFPPLYRGTWFSFWLLAQASELSSRGMLSHGPDYILSLPPFFFFFKIKKRTKAHYHLVSERLPVHRHIYALRSSLRISHCCISNDVTVPRVITPAISSFPKLTWLLEL